MMEPRPIKKLEKPIHPFEPAEGWTTLSPEAASKVYRAMESPLRRKILELLDGGPMRQKELISLLSQTTGKKLDLRTFLYHLRILEEAGLLGHEETVEEGIHSKIIFIVKDIRLQACRRTNVPPGG
jgi:predicted transcriptional regulator